jgi:hypothetical protein
LINGGDPLPAVGGDTATGSTGRRVTFEAAHALQTPGNRHPRARYFMAEGRRVVGQCDFRAESDAAALDVAQPVFDACSDRARSFEVWHGARLMALGAGSMTLKAIIDKRQTQVIELEERIRDSKWAVASSQRLLQRLKELKPLTAARPTTEDAQSSGATRDVA